MKAPFFIALLFVFNSVLVSASELDIIDLHNRPAGEIIPLIKPMLNADESVTGRGFQLILKADATRQAQIRELVSKLDRAAAQLMISVFQGSERDLQALGAAAGIHYRDSNADIQLGSSSTAPGGASATLQGNRTTATGRIYGTRAHLQDNPIHRLRIMEGTAGYIETGQSIPYFSGQVYQRNGQSIVESSVDYKDVTSGFYVRPRVSGERVILDISPHRDALDPGGAINTRSATTTISGRLGEWIPLGGTTGELKRGAAQPGKYYSTQDRHSESIWIKADPVQ
ncbi:type II/III secretion system protein [Thiogranum longum]|uniref:Type II/III secretion system protein n=1 Tax=Thiogranum longum TaxID=1537524 RepID=A0A4R1H8V8_9GAMM|nr:hypothetical protein [Thiogranum longum]TCK18277.1 type II/III secretion system protein [Thiogranum longum]